MKKASDYMEFAIEQALIAMKKDEVPVGAVITYKDEIIAASHNQTISNNNPLDHAEFLAIQQAIKITNEKYLSECDLYVTLEPCVMCAGAIVLSRIRRVYIGADDPKSGAAGSVLNILQNENLNHRCEVYFDINGVRCSELLKEFFMKKRKIEQV